MKVINFYNFKEASELALKGNRLCRYGDKDKYILGWERQRKINTIYSGAVPYCTISSKWQTEFYNITLDNKVVPLTKGDLEAEDWMIMENKPEEEKLPIQNKEKVFFDFNQSKFLVSMGMGIKLLRYTNYRLVELVCENVRIIPVFEIGRRPSKSGKEEKKVVFSIREVKEGYDRTPTKEEIDAKDWEIIVTELNEGNN